MAKLLVSVRSAAEAQAALAGGASIIDVKEPLHGSLGRAPCAVWREVRRVVPESIPVSVALGELNEWFGTGPSELPRESWPGIRFVKLGLSHAGPTWQDRWEEVRRRLGGLPGPTRPAWVAVVYIDWKIANAPNPDSVIDAALEIEECRGVLFDTWNKSIRSTIDLTWKQRIARVRSSSRFTALAGGVDSEAIERLASLEPDIVAVRGGACSGGDRHAPIDIDRVAVLAHAAASISERMDHQLRAVNS